MEIVYIYIVIEAKRIMKITLDIKPLIISILAAIIAIMTINGQVQQVIGFADPLNEMIFAFAAAMITIFSFGASVEIDKK